MVSKWFVHRRSEQRHSARPFGIPLGQPGIAGKPPEARSPPTLRTEVRVDRGNGSQKPKTIITIRRSGGKLNSQEKTSSGISTPSSTRSNAIVPAAVRNSRDSRSSSGSSGGSPSASPVTLQTSRSTSSPLTRLPLVNRTHLSQARLASPVKLIPTARCTDPVDWAPEDMAETFGIEPEMFGSKVTGSQMPGSPSSTLHNEPKLLLMESASSAPYSSFDRASSITSVETTATAVDDGLSPWGLPKILDPFDDEELDGGVAEDMKDPYELDFEAELAHIDSEFGLVRESIAAKAPLKAAKQAEQLRKVRVLTYTLRLAVSQRIRNYKLQAEREAAKEEALKAQRATALNSKFSFVNASKALVSSFGALI